MSRRSWVMISLVSRPELGRTRARCPGCSGSVSRVRPPNRTCGSHRIRLSTCLSRCSAARDGSGPGGRYVRSAVAVAGHRDAGGAGEHDPVVGDPPTPVAEPAPELLSAGQSVFTADPAGHPQPRVAVDGTEGRLGHPMSKVVRPPPQGPVQAVQQLVDVLVPG